MSGEQYRNCALFVAEATGRAVNTGAGVRYVPRRVHSTTRVLSMPDPRDIMLGGLVGAAVIRDVLTPIADLSLVRAACINCELAKGACAEHSFWRMEGCYGFMLGKRIRLPFRKMNGRQRWFHVEITQDEERLLREAGMLDAT